LQRLALVEIQLDPLPDVVLTSHVLGGLSDLAKSTVPSSSHKLANVWPSAANSTVVTLRADAMLSTTLFCCASSRSVMVTVASEKAARPCLDKNEIRQSQESVMALCH
jgi:hypothetical protein